MFAWQSNQRNLAIIFFVLLVSLPLHVIGQDNQAEIDVLRQSILDRSAEIIRLQEEIAQYESEVNVVSDQKQTLERDISTINITRKKLQAEIKLKQQEISSASNKITDLQGDIQTHEQLIVQQQDSLARSMRIQHEIDEATIFEFLFTDDTFSSVLDRFESLQKFQRQLREQIVLLALTKQNLKQAIVATAQEQQLLVQLQDSIEDRKAIVDDQKNEKDELLRVTEKKEENYKSLIAEREALVRAYESELRDYESRLLFILDPTILPKPGTEPLSWPLENVVVTQLFGVKTGPHRIYTNGHSGVDFRARTPVPVYAMANGVVGGTGDTDLACRSASFGQWVFIRYDNNLASTYGHLSRIIVEPGQRVQRGQIVGYSGNTGRTTAPHLHVSVYAAIDADGAEAVEIKGLESKACKGKILVQPRASRQAYLDPLLYLPTASKNNFKTNSMYSTAQTTSR